VCLEEHCGFHIVVCISLAAFVWACPYPIDFDAKLSVCKPLQVKKRFFKRRDAPAFHPALFAADSETCLGSFGAFRMARQKDSKKLDHHSLRLKNGRFVHFGP
jgi:hypothetical protein